jgi:hypothetical protein
MWWHRSLHSRRGEVQSHETCGSPKALPNRELESSAARSVAAHGYTPRLLSYLEACTQGYSVCMVPTVAPGPTSGEASNQQVGPASLFPTQLF